MRWASPSWDQDCPIFACLYSGIGFTNYLLSVYLNLSSWLEKGSRRLFVIRDSVGIDGIKGDRMKREQTFNSWKCVDYGFGFFPIILCHSRCCIDMLIHFSTWWKESTNHDGKAKPL
jgi:hypothetical protein